MSVAQQHLRRWICSCVDAGAGERSARLHPPSVVGFGDCCPCEVAPCPLELVVEAALQLGLKLELGQPLTLAVQVQAQEAVELQQLRRLGRPLRRCR